MITPSNTPKNSMAVTQDDVDEPSNNTIPIKRSRTTRTQ